jgi:hypothetical protein
MSKREPIEYLFDPDTYQLIKMIYIGKTLCCGVTECNINIYMSREQYDLFVEMNELELFLLIGEFLKGTKVCLQK